MNAATIAGVSTCPACGRSIGRPRPTGTTATVVDTSRLSDAELYRHYKRSAPVEDLRFFLRCVRLSTDLRTDAEALLTEGCRDTGGTLARAEWYRRLTALQDRWRRQTVDIYRSTISDVVAEAV